MGTEKSSDDLEEIAKILDANPEFVRNYFLKNATPKLVESWVMERSHRLSVLGITPIGRIAKSGTDLVLRPLKSPVSVASNMKLRKLYGNRDVEPAADPTQKQISRAVKDLTELSERDLFMELIMDIAHELDIDKLSHKILVNVSILTNGDRCSLFLVKGHKDRKYLVSRLFDVTTESTVEEAVRPEEDAIIIPVGVGIAGHAAETGSTINIADAYKDPRFNQAVDQRTGYRTHSILCMPIKSQEGQVIGVAQIINKKSDVQLFTEKDEEVFRNYLMFCGIGLTNAQLFDLSVKEFKRNQALLNLARNIFEDTERLETVVRRIMSQAHELLPCERCTVYILDKDSILSDSDVEQSVVFSRVFDLVHDESIPLDLNDEDYWKAMAKKSCPNESKIYSAFAMLVAKSGEVLNFDKINKDKVSTGNLLIDDINAKCMLCAPIFNNNHEVIGVAQLINKKESHFFDENDEAIFEGFAVFCGLGLHNTQMYEKAAIMIARQQVNMEILSYHASASAADMKRFEGVPIPPREQYQLSAFAFDDFHMNDDETILMSMRMFLDLDLLYKMEVPEKVMLKFLLTVKKNYRPVIYHNWRHAFNVAQTVYTMLTTGSMAAWFTDLETFVLIVACLCHDLDHRGTNNNFQVKSESPIAMLYGSSTMEHHHYDHSVMILNSEGSGIFNQFKDSDFKLAMKLLEEAILATDLALYFKKRAKFQDMVENNKADWTIFENRSILRAMMMTACDVSAITKPWPVQQRVAELVASEFWEQGDLERSKLSAEPVPMMDRKKGHELPKMQVGFIDFVCLPVYKVFYHINPLLKPLYDGVLENKKNWQNVADNGYDPDKAKAALHEPQRKSIYPGRSNIADKDRGKKVVSFQDGPTKSSFCRVM